KPSRMGTRAHDGSIAGTPIPIEECPGLREGYFLEWSGSSCRASCNLTFWFRQHVPSSYHALGGRPILPSRTRSFFREGCCRPLVAAEVGEPVTIKLACALGRDRSQASLEKRAGKGIEQAFAALALRARAKGRENILGLGIEISLRHARIGLPLAAQEAAD